MDSELAGGASMSPSTDQPLEATSGEAREQIREEWVEHEFEGGAKPSVSDLDVYYGDDHALNGVSMEIPENSVTALIGPSGCGKSTFLRCLNRMNDRIKAARIDGSAWLEDEEIYQEGINLVELCECVGMVFQSPNPFPKSIAGNISYGSRKHGDLDTGLLANLLGRSNDNTVDEFVEYSLRQMALWDEVQDRPDNSAFGLSDGQQQWLCIARVLATDPEVFPMDEPASALDPIATSKIEDPVHDLVEEYMVVTVTHNMQQAVCISNQTAVFLTGGKLAGYGGTDQVFENPQDQHVEDYISGKFGQRLGSTPS